MQETLIPKHGGYRSLKSFRVAQLVYDVTVLFCERFVDRRSRTHDQMVQAARSGVQNIAEGSQASGTSRKMELKLTNVAMASLEELRQDYEDSCGSAVCPNWSRATRRWCGSGRGAVRRLMRCGAGSKRKWTGKRQWTGTDFHGPARTKHKRRLPFRGPCPSVFVRVSPQSPPRLSPPKPLPPTPSCPC